MMTSAEEAVRMASRSPASQLIEREAMRHEREKDNAARVSRNTFATRVRDIVLTDEGAIEHDIRRKAVVSAHDSPLDGLSGYHQLISQIERRSVLAQIGGAWVPFEAQASVLTTPAATAWVNRANPKPISQMGLAKP
jgi:hypothetical protein